MQIFLTIITGLCNKDDTEFSDCSVGKNVVNALQYSVTCFLFCQLKRLSVEDEYTRSVPNNDQHLEISGLEIELQWPMPLV